MIPGILGLSSYFLWTQKGFTQLPLVRGSGFVVPFRQLNGFHRLHVVTAAHVACPVKYPQLFSSDASSSGLKAIGQRHISTRLLEPRGPGCGAFRSHPLRFQQHFMPHVDVCVLRMEDEGAITAGVKEAGGSGNPSVATPFEVDVSPLQDGEEIVLCGVECKEESGNPSDDGLCLTQVRYHAVCKVALVSVDYGTVFLGSLADHTDMGVNAFPSSLCGGPVVRKANGKAVGVIVARVTCGAPPVDASRPARVCDPFLDISDNKEVLERAPCHVAFVPFSEFEGAMRRSEA